MVQRPKSTVGDIIRRHQQQGKVDLLRKGRCGRKPALEERDIRAICRTSLVNPQMTAREIQAEVGGRVSNVSIDTVKRTLRRYGRISYRPAACPLLSTTNKAVRLRWCREHSYWTTDQWRKVSYNCQYIPFYSYDYITILFECVHSGDLLR
jgi:transposase